MKSVHLFAFCCWFLKLSIVVPQSCDCRALLLLGTCIRVSLSAPKMFKPHAFIHHSQSMARLGKCQMCLTMPTLGTQVFTKALLRVTCSSFITSILAWTGAQLAAQALVHMLKQAAKVRSQPYMYFSKLNVILNAECEEFGRDAQVQYPCPTTCSHICGAAMRNLSPSMLTLQPCVSSG